MANAFRVGNEPGTRLATRAVTRGELVKIEDAVQKATVKHNIPERTGVAVVASAANENAVRAMGGFMQL